MFYSNSSVLVALVSAKVAVIKYSHMKYPNG
jgi:hypothetical protein